MPYITQVAVGKLPQLRVFGDDYPTRDGTGVRDYIHVVDLAIGHLKALEKINQASGVHIYNLGTGRGYSVLEVIAAFEKRPAEKFLTLLLSGGLEMLQNAMQIHLKLNRSLVGRQSGICCRCVLIRGAGR